MDHYVKLAPGEFNPYDSKADIYLAFGDLDSARYWREKAAAFEPGTAVKLAWDALLRQDYSAAERYYHQAGMPTQIYEIAIHRGRLLEAEQQMQKLESPPLQWLIWTSYERGHYPAMLKYTQEMSGILKDDLADKVYGRDLLALALLKNGNPKRAYELLEEVRKDISKVNYPSQQSQYDCALGLLALEEGKHGVALKQFDAAFEFAYPNRAGQFHYGVGLLKAGRLAEAINELEKASRKLPIGFLDKTSLNFLPTHNYWLLGCVKSHYWLGVAYEQQGSKNKAIAEYEKFLEIWKDADFDSPELSDAKVRLAKLKQG